MYVILSAILLNTIKELRLLGQVKYGIYDRQGGVPDATLAREIARDQASNIRHEAINVPQEKCPLSAQSLDRFLQVLAEVAEKDIIPYGYGLRIHGSEIGDWEEIEVLQRGRKRNDVEVVLPRSIWFPRAKLWVQSLNVLGHFIPDM
jgi:hypothetical protein